MKRSAGSGVSSPLPSVALATESPDSRPWWQLMQAASTPTTGCLSTGREGDLGDRRRASDCGRSRSRRRRRSASDDRAGPWGCRRGRGTSGSRRRNGRPSTRAESRLRCSSAKTPPQNDLHDRIATQVDHLRVRDVDRLGIERPALGEDVDRFLGDRCSLFGGRRSASGADWANDAAIAQHRQTAAAATNSAMTDQST